MVTVTVMAVVITEVGNRAHYIIWAQRKMEMKGSLLKQNAPLNILKYKTYPFLSIAPLVMVVFTC